MKTNTMLLTHFSLIGFDGKSTFWKDWENFPFLTGFRCPVSNSHYPGVFMGSLWHVSLNHHHFCPQYGSRKPEIKVTGTIKLGEMVVIEYGKARYAARVNFGFDQSVLAFSILGIEGSDLSERIWTNSIKVYTNILTTKAFLKGGTLHEMNEDTRTEPKTKRSGGVYY